MQYRMRWITVLALAGLTTLAVARAQTAADELQRAAASLQQRNEAEAWRLFQEHRKQFNETWFDLDWRLVAWGADQLRLQQDFTGALALCGRVMARESDIPPELAAAVLMVRGDVFRDQQNFAAARLEYEGVNRHPAYRETAAGRQARFRLLTIMRITREYESALQMIERLKDERDLAVQAEAFYHHAHIAFDRQEFDLAREMIGEVKARKPEHIETVFIEGELNLIQNRLQDPELEIGEQRLQTFVIPGRPILIRLRDPNLAVVRGGGGIPILLRTSVGKDREAMMLMPSPRDPTLFRGAISTKLGKAEVDNMILELLGSDSITYNIEPEFQRANDLSYADKTMTVVADAELLVSAGEIIDQEERDARALRERVARAQARGTDAVALRAFERVRDVNTVRPGNPIYIHVEDLDRSVSAFTDSVPVRVSASSGASIEKFALTETELHSGVFRGSLETMVSEPRARALDSAPGHDPAAVIDARRADAVWRSAEGGRSPKWLEVDLMRSSPVHSAELELAEGSDVQRVTLMAGPLTTVTKIADNLPSDAERFGFLDLDKLYPKLRNTAAYIYTEITSPVAQNGTLKIGTADGVECWVNGASVHRSPRGRTWQPEQDVVSVSLREGVNGILLKVFQISDSWGASLSVLDAQGASLSGSDAYPSLAPGAVTRWHVFDYPTDAAIQVPERITLSSFVRVGERFVRWLPHSTAPTAWLTIEGNRVRAVFHDQAGWRLLRWVFDEFSGASVAVREVRVDDRSGNRIVPRESGGDTLSGLAIGPGDTIDVVYYDEIRTREDDGMLRATMRSGYHNALVAFEYENISMDPRGNRMIQYDTALRYRPGHTETLIVRVTDYDEDTTPERDTVPVRVTTTSGEVLEMTALETSEHSGEFLATLRLGTNSTDAARGMLAVGANDDLMLTYLDTENSDGILARQAVVSDAGTGPPQMVLYQTALVQDTEGLLGERGAIKQETRLPRDDPQSRGEPVVTSLAAPLTFKVHYPMAALSVNSTFKARLITASERVAAEAEGRAPQSIEVDMRLTSPEDAIFEAKVPLQIGGVETAPTAGMPIPGASATPALAVRGEEVVTVEIVSLNPGTVYSATFRLASDGRLDFTDRRYDEVADAFHAGDYLYLRVIDPDRSVSTDLDSVQVSLSGQVDSVEVTLVETLPHSGVFTGRVRTQLKEVQAPATAKPDATEAAASTEAEETVPLLSLTYGERVRAVYIDTVSVLTTTPLEVVAAISVYPGDDGAVSSFTRRFRDDEMAVQTRLLMAEALFEMAKEHRRGKLEELAQEEMAEGKTLLEEAVVNYPNSPFAAQAEFLLANLAQEIELYEQALERYNRVLAVWPDSEYAPRAMLRKAQTLETLEDHINASDTYVELTYTYPDSPLAADAIVRLGQHFYRREEFPVAALVFGNFAPNYPEHVLAPRALFLAGQSYMKSAEVHKQKLDLRLYDAQSKEWLESAVEQFERLINDHEGERDLRAEAMYWTADTYVKLNDMPEAYKVFKRLTWDYPESNWARFARGRLTDAAFSRIEETM